MRFSFKLGSMAAIVLHEDVLSSNSTTGHLDSSSVHQMKSASAHFFSQVGLLSLMGAGAKDLSSAKDKLDAACSKSHLRSLDNKSNRYCNPREMNRLDIIIKYLNNLWQVNK